MMLADIPPLSFSQYFSDPQGFARSLGGQVRRYGFAVISEHGIAQDLCDQAYEAAQAFFALPDSVKRKYHQPGGGGARGYTPFGIETAKGAQHSDLKEFWHVGRDLGPGHRFRDHMGDNLWPDEVPAFRPVFSQLYAALDGVGRALVSALARDLGLAPDWFEPALKDGNSILRLLHYPPVPVDSPAVRAGAHEDINTITLLLGAEEAGLELLDRDGRWIAVNPPPGCLVCNIGDMLQRHTNNVLPSTTHRVVNPAPERRHVPRYSIPFFLHYASDFLIETLPGCATAANPNRYPVPITANAYLEERLAEIKLK